MMSSQSTPPLKFLVIRRDNIGDLACTTPVFRALRTHYPDSFICALVNSYNLPVLANNPDINQSFAYTKAKHRPPGKSILGVYWDRLRLVHQLRQLNFDFIILAGPGFQKRSLVFARLLKPKHIVGFVQDGERGIEHIDKAMPYLATPQPIHEVEDTFRLLATIGIESKPPNMCIVADPTKASAVQAQINQKQWPANIPIFGIHISARKPSQRWPTSNFVTIIRKLHQSHNAAFLLFWSPGDDKNPMHPGDDAKALEIMHGLVEIPILAYPTQELGQLIAGLSVCDIIVCSDGGAMHLAAGLGKPILCFFGKSESTRWHPWGVPYVLLQPNSFDVKDVSVNDAYIGIQKLLNQEIANNAET